MCVPWDLASHSPRQIPQAGTSPSAPGLSAQLPAASAAGTSVSLVRQALHLRKTRSQHNYPAETHRAPPPTPRQRASAAATGSSLLQQLKAELSWTKEAGAVL